MATAILVGAQTELVQGALVFVTAQAPCGHFEHSRVIQAKNACRSMLQPMNVVCVCGSLQRVLSPIQSLDCLCRVLVADTFYPSTGMSMRQRCINTAAALSVRAMAYFHGDFGPIRKLADRQVLGMAWMCAAAQQDSSGSTQLCRMSNRCQWQRSA
jgi:hypothetical protein